MSAHVNLLPPELAQRSRASRTRNLTILAVVAWLAILAVFYVLKLGTVAAVERERNDAQAQVDTLNQRVAELQPYAELDAQLAARNDLLAAAMATEVSWARVLNDLALAFPGNSSLLTLTANTSSTGDPGQVQPVAGQIGAVDFTGYSVQEFAPGVEVVILRLNEVSGFRNSFVSQAGEEERGRTEVTAFVGNADLTDEIYTGRYADGLPPEPAG